MKESNSLIGCHIVYVESDVLQMHERNQIDNFLQVAWGMFTSEETRRVREQLLDMQRRGVLKDFVMTFFDSQTSTTHEQLQDEFLEVELSWKDGLVMQEEARNAESTARRVGRIIS